MNIRGVQGMIPRKMFWNFESPTVFPASWRQYSRIFDCSTRRDSECLIEINYWSLFCDNGARVCGGTNFWGVKSPLQQIRPLGNKMSLRDGHHRYIRIAMDTMMRKCLHSNEHRIWDICFWSHVTWLLNS